MPEGSYFRHTTPFTTRNLVGFAAFLLLLRGEKNLFAQPLPVGAHRAWVAAEVGVAREIQHCPGCPIQDNSETGPIVGGFTGALAVGFTLTSRFGMAVEGLWMAQPAIDSPAQNSRYLIAAAQYALPHADWLTASAGIGTGKQGRSRPSGAITAGAAWRHLALRRVCPAPRASR